MGRLSTLLAHRFLRILFYFEWKRYVKDSQYLNVIQSNYLMKLLRLNEKTQFGMEHSFEKGTTLNGFQKFVPISKYEDYISYINQIRKGKRRVLTSEKVLKFSLSSGTSSASKLIPNTVALKGEFDRAVSVWLYDLYRQFPSLQNGKSFWIITPSLGNQNQYTNQEVVFEDDSEYFYPLKRWLIRAVFAVPDEVPKLCKGDNYYVALGVFLLSNKFLRLISVWNPSVFMILLDKMLDYKDLIFKSIETGRLYFPYPISIESQNILNNYLKKSTKRAIELKFLFKNSKSVLWEQVWPKLTLISAWDSAWAEGPALVVKQKFDRTYFQGKGLLATEACVTIPLYITKNTYAFLPAYKSHFFEFKEVNSEKLFLLHELQISTQYEVIITTSGGFYRYCLNDLVTCTGYWNGLPILRFDGKSNLVVDLTGEKLHESHVSGALQTTFKHLGVISSFYFMAPEAIGQSFHYTLFLITDTDFDSEELVKEIECVLGENMYYQHSRNLHQLNKLKVKRLKPSAQVLFLKTMEKNYKLSSYKHVCLRSELDWSEVFEDEMEDK